MRYTTSMNLGIVFALIALVAWAFDDFFIGRSTKKLGDAGALFCLSVFGAIVLFPFAYQTLGDARLWSPSQGFLWILCGIVVVTLIAALADFEALRIGKLSTIDPLYALEVPLTLLLSYLVIRETLGATQLYLVACIVCGMILVAVKSFKGLKNVRWERGVRMALVSILFMSGVNFLSGYGGRITTPVFANWFSYMGLAVCTGTYLLVTGKMRPVLQAIRANPKLVLALSIADVIAWSSFIKSASLIPIGLATAISEAYIAFAVLLGIYANKEKVHKHQVIGICIVVAAVLTLSITSR